MYHVILIHPIVLYRVTLVCHTVLAYSAERSLVSPMVEPGTRPDTEGLAPGTWSHAIRCVTIFWGGASTALTPPSRSHNYEENVTASTARIYT